MVQKIHQMLFLLLRSAIRGIPLSEAERAEFSDELLQKLLEKAKAHDVAHLVTFALKQNGLLREDDIESEKMLYRAFLRQERLDYDYSRLCTALEQAEIPFLPLKGAVVRKYYPETWMRTSCDIDILVRREDLEKAVSFLVKNLNYTKWKNGKHDISMFSPEKNCVEIHFDLVEEGRARNAKSILNTVWDHVSLRDGSKYWYEMNDAFFYFYHVAHMAKHFEDGGCGIRPFLDLWLLDHLGDVDQEGRDQWLAKGGLLQFANTARRLSAVWLDEKAIDPFLLQVQVFVLHGGVYGLSDNRVSFLQRKRGGRVKFVISRVFVPLNELRQMYPTLEKRPWLMPFVQVGRWFKVFRPSAVKRTLSLISVDRVIEDEKVSFTPTFFERVGL